MHHIATPGFVDIPRRSDCTAGLLDGEAGWWTTSRNIGLPQLARVMGVGRQQQHQTYNSNPHNRQFNHFQIYQDDNLPYIIIMLWHTFILNY